MLETLTKHYTHYAWASNDKALQAGRWGQIKHSLDALEPDWPGLTAEVMGRLKRLRQGLPSGSIEAQGSTLDKCASDF